MLVQARNKREFLPTSVKKGLAAAHADFLQSLQAVGDKRRAHDEQLFHAVLCEPHQLLVGVRL